MDEKTQFNFSICNNNEETWVYQIISDDDVARTVSAAENAYPAWRSFGQKERAELINKLADALEDDVECLFHSLKSRGSRFEETHSHNLSINNITLLYEQVA